MNKTERVMLKQIITILDGAVSIDSIDVSDLSNQILLIEANAEGELAELLATAAFAVSDIEIDEENDFKDRIVFATDSIANVLAYSPSVSRKKNAHPGISFRWNKDRKTGCFRF